MKVKINILITTVILTIIVFSISTYMQKKLINYEATISCLILIEDIVENELVSEEKFKLVDMPISIVANQRIITNFTEIEGLYAKDNIKESQIAIRSQFDTKENLSIYEAEEGKEKISIKIKTAENGMSFQIKENSLVNVYVTISSEYATNFLNDKERLIIGDELNGYTVIKLLEKIKVLGAFTVDGIDVTKATGENIDSILISVTPDEAKEINLLREIGSFNITGINTTQILSSNDNIQSIIKSGDTITDNILNNSGDILGEGN